MAKFILPYNIFCHIIYLPPLSHYVTAPGGALGTVFPRPLASLRSDRFVLHLEAVLNCLFEGLRVKNFSFDRFFQGR